MSGRYAIGFGPQTRWSRNRLCSSAYHKVRTASHFGIIEPFSGVKGFINERFFFSSAKRIERSHELSRRS